MRVSKKTLLIIDMQNDFVEGGPLAVQGALELAPTINRLMGKFDSIVATLDWHPQGHVSFASSHKGHSVGDMVEVRGVQQVLWSDHCIQDTYGSAILDAIETENVTMFVQKGTSIEVDSYSAFFDNDKSSSTGLVDYLREIGTEELTIVGVALDYCVKYSVLDALSEGFRVKVVTDATAGVEVRPGDSERTLVELAAAGAALIKAEEVYS